MRTSAAKVSEVAPIKILNKKAINPKQGPSKTRFLTFGFWSVLTHALVTLTLLPSFSLAKDSVSEGQADQTAISPLPANLWERHWVLQPEDRSAYRFILMRPLESSGELSFFPVYFEQGYTENLTVIWAPIPLHFRYRFLTREKWSFYTELAFLGLATAREKDFNWRPFLSVQAQFQWFPRLQLGLELHDTIDIKRGGQTSIGNMLSMRLKSRAIPASFLSIEGWTDLVLESGQVRARYPGALPPDVDDRTSRFRVLFGLSATLLPVPFFELRADLDLYAFGYTGGYWSLPFVFTSSIYF
jgi:hypothetical protein